MCALSLSLHLPEFFLVFRFTIGFSTHSSFMGVAEGVAPIVPPLIAPLICVLVRDSSINSFPSVKLPLFLIQIVP